MFKDEVGPNSTNHKLNGKVMNLSKYLTFITSDINITSYHRLKTNFMVMSEFVAVLDDEYRYFVGT